MDLNLDSVNSYLEVHKQKHNAGLPQRRTTWDAGALMVSYMDGSLLKDFDDALAEQDENKSSQTHFHLKSLVRNQHTTADLLPCSPTNLATIFGLFVMMLGSLKIGRDLSLAWKNC